jgi:carbon monoxide dehydrogenase subunit G
LAQIGSRLIRGTVSRLTAEFFVRFAEALGAEAAEMPVQGEQR